MPVPKNRKKLNVLTVKIKNNAFLDAHVGAMWEVAANVIILIVIIWNVNVDVINLLKLKKTLLPYQEEITLRILDSYCKQNRSDSYNFTMYELVNMYEESLRRVKEIYKKEK